MFKLLGIHLRPAIVAQLGLAPFALRVVRRGAVLPLAGLPIVGMALRRVSGFRS